MTRKKNEEALRKEEAEQFARKVASLRREERVYANATKKGEEEAAFAQIRAEIEGRSGKGQKALIPAALADEVQRQVDARLRVYAGPERDILEADGSRVYRQRYYGGWKNVEDGLGGVEGSDGEAVGAELW